MINYPKEIVGSIELVINFIVKRKLSGTHTKVAVRHVDINLPRVGASIHLFLGTPRKHLMQKHVKS